MLLTKQQVDDIFDTACARVTVSCDEAEAHSAMKGCVSVKQGSRAKKEDIVNICKLVEHIREVEERLKGVKAYDDGDGEEDA